MNKTLEALDALVASFLNEHSANIAKGLGEIVIAALALAGAWFWARRTKIKTAADGAVDTMAALAAPRIDMDGPTRKAGAQDLLAEITGITAQKLGDEVQAAWRRRKELQQRNKNSVRPPV